MKVLNNDDFNTTIEKGTVLVDFFADWCGPCKMLGPVLEKVSADYEGKMGFAKVNVDDCPELAQKYGVMSIPNVIIFKDGVQKDQMIGFAGEGAVKEFIERNLD